MTDLIKRLRERAARKWTDEANRSASLFGEAADEIERLRERAEAGAESWNALQRALKEIERLRRNASCRTEGEAMTMPPLPEPGMTEVNPYLDLGPLDPHSGKPTLEWYSQDQRRAYGEACAAAERERCAKVADAVEDWVIRASDAEVARHIAANIRRLKP